MKNKYKNWKKKKKNKKNRIMELLLDADKVSSLTKSLWAPMKMLPNYRRGRV